MGLVSEMLGKVGLKSAVTTLISILGIASAVVGLKDYFERHLTTDLSGEWRITNTIDHTSYSPFQGMKLEYRVFFHQRELDFTADGEKVKENGRSLNSFERTPIKFSGTLRGSAVVGTFTEQGTQRATAGRFSWRLVRGRRKLVGEFSSTAANASGSTNGMKR